MRWASRRTPRRSSPMRSRITAATPWMTRPGPSTACRPNTALRGRATRGSRGAGESRAARRGAASQLCTSPFTVAGDGTHAVDYYATDVAGNVESTHSVSVKIDTVSPASLSQVAGTPAGGGYLSPVTVTLSASDATSGIQSISYRIDGGAQWTYSAPFRVAGNGTP